MPDWAITQEQFNTLLVRTFDAIGDHVMNFLGTCGANEKYQYITTPLVPQQKITR